MVPCMADHPIPKLAEPVGDSTPSGPNLEENETTWLGVVRVRLALPLMQRSCLHTTLSGRIGTKDEAADDCRKNRMVSTCSGLKIVR
jgi:hypothetical protein